VQNGSSLTTIEPAIIVDHKHDFPLKYIPVRYSTADTRYIFVSLHLFELASKQAAGCRSGHGGPLKVGQRVGIRSRVMGEMAVQARLGCNDMVFVLYFE
jgi:hypothetical protein